MTGGLPVSRITLGTMRLGRAGGVAEAARLISHAFDIGIRSFHCSSEYESFPLFAAAWKRAGLAARGATLIAKVASPHFGEDRFSSAQVRAKLDDYCRMLDVDRINTVQWLLRHDLQDDVGRARILAEADEEIAGLATGLKTEGRISAFVGFPYTRPIAEMLVAAPWCDALALYINALEREMDAVAIACAAAGKAVVAIRPFAAGRVFAEGGLSADEALDHAFAFPAVATAVASASREGHLNALRPWLGADVR